MAMFTTAPGEEIAPVAPTLNFPELQIAVSRFSLIGQVVGTLLDNGFQMPQ